MNGTADHNGNPLAEGDHAEAWRDGARYTATVREIRPHAPGDGDFRRVILSLDADGAEAESFSDAVITLAGLPAKGEG